MQVQLTFRRMNPTYELEELVFKEAEKLERVCPHQLTWCQVVVEQPHRHKHVGRPCHVRVAVHGSVGYHIASRDLVEGTEAETLHVAIVEAFQAMRNQLTGRSLARDSGAGIARRHRALEELLPS